MRRLTLALPFVLACSPSGGSSTLTVFVDASHAPMARSLTATLGDAVRVEVAGDPVTAAEAAGDGAVAVVADLRVSEAFHVDRAGRALVVHGDTPLGVQYGLAQTLEWMGFRFFHPHRSFVPPRRQIVPDSELGILHAPERRQRGLHLHTLHPIEAYFDFWEPSPEHLANAKAEIDWLVANRGNYVQLTGLDDVLRDDVRLAAVNAHLGELISYAHARGVRFGFGLQLYGESNLQRAFDLIESTSIDPAADIAARLDRIAPLAFDSVQVSFGEFVGLGPDQFLADLDVALQAIHARWPSADVSGVVHVGNFPRLDVSYMGQTLNYYHLVRFVSDPAFVPWIHTVMYYDLYEDAGGAYNYDAFTDQRAYLYARLAAGEDVVYFPETAYWIAFDNSLPTYLPLYVRNRHVDLARSRADGAAMGFDADFGHVIFSSGWEWGYWQNDWASLRMSYELPTDHAALIQTMWSPYGRKGLALADEINAMIDTQKAFLMDERLAAWLASRDFTFAAGEALGVNSQPDRPDWPEIVAMTATERAAFRTDVVDRLAAMRDAFAAHRDAIDSIGLQPDPFLDEVRDGAAVNVERAAFIHQVLLAVLAHADGDEASSDAALAAADAHMRAAATIVDRRHAALHHPEGETMTSSAVPNATTYQYGYLREAATRCFYERELFEVTNLVEGTTYTVPPCAIL